MKSKIYVMIPWPECQKLEGIEAVDNVALKVNCDQPSIIVPIDVAADYLDGEVINGEFIWSDDATFPESQRHKIEISIFKSGCILKCDNKDIILRARICIQETFHAATHIDERGWLHTDKFIVEDQWKDLFREQFNPGAILLEFKN